MALAIDWRPALEDIALAHADRDHVHVEPPGQQGGHGTGPSPTPTIGACAHHHLDVTALDEQALLSRVEHDRVVPERGREVGQKAAQRRGSSARPALDRWAISSPRGVITVASRENIRLREPWATCL